MIFHSAKQRLSLAFVFAGVAGFAATASAQVPGSVRLSNSPSFSRNTPVMPSSRIARPWTPRTSALPRQTYDYQYPQYSGYFRRHVQQTTRGLLPSNAVPNSAAPVRFGTMYATQARQARQATQATQARQYRQPAFRRCPY